MQKIKLFLTISALLIMQYSGKLNAQVIFSLGSQSGINSSKVVIPVTVQNFTDIATVQFSVNWDADVVNYMAAEDYAFNSITGTSFGTSSVDAGILRFSWNAVEVESQTLNNGDTLFSIRYNIVGQEGESSLIEITNDPIAIEVTDLNYEEKEVTVNSGLIEVTPDTMSPTVPTGLSATPTSHSQVDLSWGASSDNVGVSGYEVYRNGAEVASVNATTYSDTGLVAETEYSYQVRAVDSSGNVSALSSAASTTTPAKPDTISPTVPTGLSATPTSHSQVDLSWGASSDNVGVSGYEIYRNGAEVASVNATTYSGTGLVAETEYSYQVRAVDSSGNVSALSSAVSATTPAKPDTISPTVPTGLSATAISHRQVDLSWGASSDNIGVSGYEIYRNGAEIASVNATTYSDTGLMAETEYSYQVRAVDSSGNASALSRAASAITPAKPDTISPTVPTGLSAMAISHRQVDLSWGASSDNVGVSGYEIYRNGAEIASVNATTYSDTGLVAETEYSYQVRAVDSSGNVSALSSAVSAITPAQPDTISPTVPTGLSATPTSHRQVDLSWGASSDNVGVSVYEVYRNGAEVASINATTYSDTGLVAETEYSYQVRAVDSSGNVSALSRAASTTTPARPDTMSPTVPTGLSTTAISHRQVDLSWGASSDNVGVSGYEVYRNGAEIASVNATTYSDTGLVAETEYSYQVRAVDSSGNVSALSSAVSAITPAQPDTISPTVPTGLSATPTSHRQVNLSWGASSDNVGVSGYEIYRNGAEVASVNATTYSDTGLVAETEYSYQVRAVDSSGNVSALSSAASAITPAQPDTIAPTVPTGLSATAISHRQVDLSWGASSDNVGVSGYKIYRNGAEVASVNATTYSDTGLMAETEYSYQVRAVDSSGNVSALSSAASAITPAQPDTISPTVPTGLSATAISHRQVDLSWGASSDNVGVSVYEVYRNGAEVASVNATTYSDTGLMAETEYSYQVRAVDSSGNVSALSSAVSATTPAKPDTISPTVPTGLSAAAISHSQVDLSWGASSDNVGVSGYEIYRNGAEVASINATTYSDTGLVAETEYSYQVRAVDSSGNASALSSAVSATTPAKPDTISPTVPTGLSATAISHRQVDLSWGASSDNVGVSGYEIYRNGAEVASINATTYSDTGLVAETEYSYQVRAVDSSGNASALSSAASAITPAQPDTMSPTVPTGLSATAISHRQVDLSWGASSDNIGVSVYEVYRNGAEVASVNATTYSDTGLMAETEYSYQVRAVDSSGNASALSSPVEIITQTSLTERVVFELGRGKGITGTEIVIPIKVRDFVDIATAQFSVNWVPDVVSYVATEDYAFNSISDSRFATNLVGEGKLTFSWFAANVESQTLNDNDTLFSIRFNLNGEAGDSSVIEITSIPVLVEVTKSDYEELQVNLKPGMVYIEALPEDREAPDMPIGLQVSNILTSQLDLSWDASSDNVGVSGYEIYRDGVKMKTLTGTSFTDTGLKAGTKYFYQVRAFDANNNKSVFSYPVVATTLGNEIMAAPLVSKGLYFGGLRAYPNPFNNKLTIDFSLMSSKLVVFSVIDVSGRVIDCFEINGMPGTNTFEWGPTEQVGSGFYYIQIKGESINGNLKVNYLK